MSVDIANNIWPDYENDTDYSECTIVGFATAIHRWIIEESDDYYPITKTKLEHFVKKTARARTRTSD